MINNYSELVIRKPGNEEEIVKCAELMSGSEPWKTLQRSFQDSLKHLNDPDKEVYVSIYDEEFAGFMIIQMKGSFTGYLQTIGIKQELRSRGIGKKMIDYAEQRILKDSPNVFLCVSSFNDRAKRLYMKLGYSVIGEIKDYIVEGHSEILMRKTIAPIAEFRKSEK